VPYLIDTNVLLRSVDLNHPMNQNAIKAITMIRNGGEQLHIVPQNLIEFWNVYTRPLERNGLGRSVTEAQAQVNRLKDFFPLLLDTEAIYPEW
jgi:predicted nucleic acid-binding protein